MGRSVHHATPKSYESDIRLFERLAQRIRLNRTGLRGADAEKATAACDEMIRLLTDCLKQSDAA